MSQWNELGQKRGCQLEPRSWSKLSEGLKWEEAELISQDGFLRVSQKCTQISGPFPTPRLPGDQKLEQSTPFKNDNNNKPTFWTFYISKVTSKRSRNTEDTARKWTFKMEDGGLWLRYQHLVTYQLYWCLTTVYLNFRHTCKHTYMDMGDIKYFLVCYLFTLADTIQWPKIMNSHTA